MAHFYLNESLESAAVGAIVELTGAEARHAVTVSRVRAGEVLTIGNGAGLVVHGVVTSADAASLTIEVGSVTESVRSTPQLWLAQALAKGDRDELAIQAATELGVDRVIPWAAARSVARWDGQKVAKGISRWEAIVREATKQSIRAWLPSVAPLSTTKELAELGASTNVIVLEPSSDLAFSSIRTDSRNVLIVVGPEGGIAPNELELLESAGATIAKLGETVLRTSTAGPAAIAVLNSHLGRW
jgi:16S rRNA (uracil1498-N3)-methyltransferase